MHQVDHSKIKYIAIAGNIGAGKTTLCTHLAKPFGWDVHYESADNNPYLSDFYMDMKRWSFNLQIYFLNNRYRQILPDSPGIGRFDPLQRGFHLGVRHAQRIRPG